MSVLSESEPKRVILLTVDALRADAARRMEGLSGLADAGVDVTDTHCTGAGTPTSMCGLMQSRLPTDHSDEPLAHTLTPDVPTLAEVLASSGFSCGGWHSNVYTSRTYDYERGYDVYADLQSDPKDRPVTTQEDEEVPETASSAEFSLIDTAKRVSERLGMLEQGTKLFYRLARRGLVDYRPHVAAEHVVDALLEWTGTKADDEPSFAYGHFMDVHSPYLPPEAYREQVESCPTGTREIWRANEQLRLQPQAITDEQATHLQGLYEAGTKYVDDQIARLVDELRTRGQWAETLLVITADHGELLGDREVPDDFPWSHANYLCDSITRVPLVIAGGSVGDRSVEGVASGIDVAPSIADAVGASIPDAWSGAPLGSPDFQNREYVYSVTGRGVRQDKTESDYLPSDTLHVSLRTEDLAVLWWSQDRHGPEFFDRTENHVDPTVHEAPLEGTAVSDADGYVETIRDRYESIARTVGDTVETAEELDQETTERLRQLGYVE